MKINAKTIIMALVALAVIVVAGYLAYKAYQYLMLYMAGKAMTGATQGMFNNASK
jgi:hypothetical protein